MVGLVADIESYNAWGIRLDVSPLRYLKNPQEAWASVYHLPVFSILFGGLIGIILIYLFIQWVSKKFVYFFKERTSYLPLLILPVLIFITVIIMRGGFQLAPMNQSAVYWSKNQKANQLAINPYWNFFFSISEGNNDQSNPYNYNNDHVVERDVKYLFDNSSSIPIIKPDIKNPNIVIIIWESFTEKALHETRDQIDVASGFKSLCNEGIYFANCYASGDRTDKGLVAVLSGYPAQPTKSILNIPTKAAKLAMLPLVLKEAGYHTSFFYGGETEFANMKSYLLDCKFDTLIEKKLFQQKDLNSKWGAYDGVVADKLFNQLKFAEQPFFSTWLTLTSHEPFETPIKVSIPGDDETSLFLNSLHYTDQVVTDFINKCAKESFWNRTIFVIVADHGHRLPLGSSKVADFHIPLLFTGGALINTGTRINRTVSQIDISKTLLNSVGLNANNFYWSKNIFNPTANWAYFAFNDGFGFVTDSSNVTFDNIGKQIISAQGKSTDSILSLGKSFLQASFQDYLSK